MKKAAILIPHYKSWKLLAICIEAFKRFQFPLEHDIVVCDNSVGHPSIKVLAETELGDGVKIVNGDPQLPSHAHGLELALEATDADWIFSTESDCWPIQDSWGSHWVKASADYDFIGPYMHLAGGKFVHPAAMMCSRDVLNAAEKWIEKQREEWDFVPAAGISLGVSDKAYHVVAKKNFIKSKGPSDSMLNEIENWRKAGPYQNMISFEDDSFSNYDQRGNIQNWEPQEGREWHLRIGYEPGQFLSSFAARFFKVFHAPCEIQWMSGRVGQQAAYSDIFGAVRHLWAGTSATVVDGLEDEVKRFKREQVNHYFSLLPENIRMEVEKLEKEYA